MDTSRAGFFAAIKEPFEMNRCKDLESRITSMEHRLFEIMRTMRSFHEGQQEHYTKVVSFENRVRTLEEQLLCIAPLPTTTADVACGDGVVSGNYSNDTLHEIESLRQIHQAVASSCTGNDKNICNHEGPLAIPSPCRAKARRLGPKPLSMPPQEPPLVPGHFPSKVSPPKTVQQKDSQGFSKLRLTAGDKDNDNADSDCTIVAAASFEPFTLSAEIQELHGGVPAGKYVHCVAAPVAAPAAFAQPSGNRSSDGLCTPPTPPVVTPLEGWKTSVLFAPSPTQSPNVSTLSASVVGATLHTLPVTEQQGVVEELVPSKGDEGPGALNLLSQASEDLCVEEIPQLTMPGTVSERVMMFEKRKRPSRVRHTGARVGCIRGPNSGNRGRSAAPPSINGSSLFEPLPRNGAHLKALFRSHSEFIHDRTSTK